MAKRLTDKYLKSLKPPASGRLVIPDAAASGLSLRLTATGAMSWLVRYRVRGQAQMGATLGPYPAVTLADARQRTAKIVAAAKGGKDLIEEEKRQREAAARAKARARTVAEVAEDFLRGSERLKSYRQRAKAARETSIIPAYRRPDRRGGPRGPTSSSFSMPSRAAG